MPRPAADSTRTRNSLAGPGLPAARKGAAPISKIRIIYRRPPDREERFAQRLLYASPDVRVTYMDRTPLRDPLAIDGRTVLESGAPVVWFTFPGEWHDIGRFHTAAGDFTGYYANIIKPVRFVTATTWEITDLFLDVWLDGHGGDPRLLDEAELRAAERVGWIDAAAAAAARAEADRLLAAARQRLWPPRVVWEWTLERALSAVSEDD